MPANASVYLGQCAADNDNPPSSAIVYDLTYWNGSLSYDEVFGSVE